MSVEASTAEAIRKPHDFEVGEVQAVFAVAPEEIHLQPELAPAQIYRASIFDPNVAYLEAIAPGRVKQIQDKERLMNDVSRGFLHLWRHREREIAYDQTQLQGSGLEDVLESTANGDKQSRERYFNDPSFLGDPGLRAWQSTIPQATALMPLANPFNTIAIENRKGERVPLTDMTREWMTACTDGWEIRNRTAIMVNEMGSSLSAYTEAHPGEPITVMSVAGGTALGTMQAIIRSGIDQSKVQLVLLESNEKSAKMAFELAERIGFMGEIIHKNVDVFSPVDMQNLKDELQGKGIKVAALDAVGIAEYSSTQHRKPEYVQRFGTDYMLYNPDRFLEACLGMVSEDGIAIIGQMLTTRPNPHFTRGVVSWPRICLRKPERFLDLMRSAGADMDLTKLILTPREAYAMAIVYKTDRAAKLGNFTPSVAVPESRASVQGMRWGVRRRRIAEVTASIIAATTLTVAREIA